VKEFTHEMGATVTLSKSGESGEVVGRAEHELSQDRFLIRYVCGDGRQVEAWWDESAIKAA